MRADRFQNHGGAKRCPFARSHHGHSGFTGN
jgi:hypothetical protein